MYAIEMSVLVGSRLISLVVFVLFASTSLAASPVGHFSSSSSISSSLPSNEDNAEQNNTVAIAILDNINDDERLDNNIPLWKRQLPFPLCNKTKTLQRIFVPGPSAGRIPSRRMNKDNGIDNSDDDNDNKRVCGVEVILLGTAHVSTGSSRDVRLLLESIVPDAIFVELCYQRLPLLVETTSTTEEEDDDDKSSDTINSDDDIKQEEQESMKPTGKFWKRWRNVNKKNKTNNSKYIDTQSLSTIASSLMSNMQEDFADSLDVELGSEFKQAYYYWKTVIGNQDTTTIIPTYVEQNQNNYQYNNDLKQQHQQQKVVHMILGDRPVSITLTRAWESLRAWGKIKLLVGLFVSSLRKPKPEEIKEWMEKILKGDTDLMSESIAELAKHFPTLETVILKERDAYMACKLYQTCRSLLMSDNGVGNNIGSEGNNPRRYRLVAIVGAGHIEGICRWLTTGGSLSTTSLNDINKSEPAASSSLPPSPQQQQQEQPEDILSQLIQTKSPIPQEDQDYLVHEITEINPDLIDDLGI